MGPSYSYSRIYQFSTTEASAVRCRQPGKVSVHGFLLEPRRGVIRVIRGI